MVNIVEQIHLNQVIIKRKLPEVVLNFSQALINAKWVQDTADQIKFYLV